MELNEMLDRIADHIVDSGTHAESHAIEAMASWATHRCPGAAAALADWNGSEIARLRAFGIVHGVLLRDLTAGDQAQLRAQLIGASSWVLVA